MENYQRVKHVFNGALDLERRERPAFLDEACADDASLRSAVERLLAAHERAASFIEAPAAEMAAGVIAGLSAVAGQQIGPYRIVRELGRGGMGTVYLAERADDQYRKQVAIKLIRYGLDREDIIRRFRSERQILASLDHPNIARLLDGGTNADGLPYIVMEYVEGAPLMDYCEQRGLSITGRLNLFRTVCSAIAYAHRNLVIHRDIKPSNILVTADGAPKLLDFGIAKVFSSSEDIEEATRTELRAMTPEYASPEQARGDQITTASDVYSLGVLLYRLLTGLHPYRIETADPLEIARAISERQPDKPSTAISRARETAAGRVEAIRLRRQLRGDLDNIALMAVRKEPARRYSSVEQFSDDIRRYLEGLPVLARKDSLSYRGGKFIRRNKLAVAAAVLIAATLVAGVIATVWQSNRASEQARIATQQRDRARLEQIKAERINSFLQQMLAYANPSWYAPGRGKQHDLTVLEALDEASRRIGAELDDQPEIKAEIHTTVGDTYRAIGRYELAEPHFEAALKLRSELFGEDHVEVAESLYYLGGVKVLRGDAATGERLYREALAIQRRTPNEGNNLPYMLLDLANLFKSRGDYAAAEPMFAEALEIFRGKHGDEHVTVAIGHEYLGSTYYGRGDLDAAFAHMNEALRIYEKTPGSRAPVPKVTLGQLSVIKKEYEAAEPLLREALSLFLDLYGEKTNHASGVRFSLARLSLERGDLQKATRETQEAMRLYRRAFGESEPNHHGGMLLGLIEHRAGRYARAESYLREALEARRRADPENAYALTELKGLLGECLVDQGKFKEAEPLLIESYDTLKPTQVEQSFRLKDARRRLATLYEQWNKPALAAGYGARLPSR